MPSSHGCANGATREPTGEQESDVRCVASPVPEAPTLVTVSVCSPSSRITDERLGIVLPVLRRVAAALSDQSRRSDSDAGNRPHRPYHAPPRMKPW